MLGASYYTVVTVVRVSENLISNGALRLSVQCDPDIVP
jgi:hypothetical protein